MTNGRDFCKTRGEKTLEQGSAEQQGEKGREWRGRGALMNVEHPPTYFPE